MTEGLRMVDRRTVVSLKWRLRGGREKVLNQQIVKALRLNPTTIVTKNKIDNPRVTEVKLNLRAPFDPHAKSPKIDCVAVFPGSGGLERIYLDTVYAIRASVTRDTSGTIAGLRVGPKENPIRIMLKNIQPNEIGQLLKASEGNERRQVATIIWPYKINPGGLIEASVINKVFVYDDGQPTVQIPTHPARRSRR